MANIQKIMTRIGAMCLVTIFVWCIIELAVQFGHYHHSCHLGEGAQLLTCMTCACIQLSVKRGRVRCTYAHMEAVVDRFQR